MARALPMRCRRVRAQEAGARAGARTRRSASSSLRSRSWARVASSRASVSCTNSDRGLQGGVWLPPAEPLAASGGSSRSSSSCCSVLSGEEASEVGKPAALTGLLRGAAAAAAAALMLRLRPPGMAWGWVAAVAKGAGAGASTASKGLGLRGREGRGGKSAPRAAADQSVRGRRLSSGRLLRSGWAD